MSDPSDDLPANISASRVRELCQKYPESIKDSLKVVDTEREQIIPSKLHARNPPRLIKSELVTLMEWKLMHGKFRPNLRKLVASNSEADVEDITCDAFKLFSAEQSAKMIKDVLNDLAKLKGVGPATSSLLLSVYDSEKAPFFSDELFRYLYLASDGKTLKGWDLKIKYNMKECLDLFERVDMILRRLNQGVSKDNQISALELEKAAYVLGKQNWHRSVAAEVSGVAVPETKSLKQFATGTKRSLDSDLAEHAPVAKASKRNGRK